MFRIVKIVIGATLVAYGLYSGNNWFFLGLLPLTMGICNKCPLGGCKDGACGVDGSCSTDNKDENSSCCSSDDSTCCSNYNKDEKSKIMSFSAVSPKQTETSCCGNNNVTVIKILGTGCANCVTLYNTVNTAIKELEGEFKVVKIEDLQEIMDYQVINTPGLVINDVVKSTGKVLNINEVIELINGSTKDLGTEIKTKCCGS